MVREAGGVLNEPDIYREWAPPPAWVRAVACCWEQRVGVERVQRVLPDGHADLIFYDSGQVEVVGLHDEVALPALSVGTHLRGIRFRPAAVGAAFRTAASSLRNRTISADYVLGSRHVRRLRNPWFADVWIRSIEPSSRTVAAVELLACRTVEETAAALGVTGRHLRRIVLADVGLAPKVYQEVVRLQRFIQATDAGVPLATAAAVAGFADQPHLTRHVRRFAGLTRARLADDRRPTTGTLSTSPCSRGCPRILAVEGTAPD